METGRKDLDDCGPSGSSGPLCSSVLAWPDVGKGHLQNGWQVESPGTSLELTTGNLPRLDVAPGRQAQEEYGVNALRDGPFSLQQIHNYFSHETRV